MKLFLCEKPSQAADISRHVGARQRCNGFNTGDGVTVTWCVGHLLEQAAPEHYNPALKVWAMEHLPVIPRQWHMNVKDAAKSQFTVIRNLLKTASEVVIATDADREGEVIAREVMQLCGYRGPLKRLWLSALDDVSVRKGLSSLLPGDKTRALYDSGLGRQRADWLAGMNLTMALTKAFGRGGKQGVAHCGRVQTPVLALVVRRERSVRNFVPKAHWVLKATFVISDTLVDMHWQTNADYLDKDGHCTKETYVRGIADTVREKAGRLTKVAQNGKKEQPPLFYSLGSLQKEASKRYGFGAKMVLDICQALYEKHKACTYPRTDCEYLPISMLAQSTQVGAALLKADRTMQPLIALADLTKPSRAFNDKKITAHHAIIPTMHMGVDMKKMSNAERLLYDLIRRRYLAQFLGAFEYQETTITGVCENETFKATGRVPLVQGWRRAYETAQPGVIKTQATQEEQASSTVLPQAAVDQPIRNHEAQAVKTHTKPPNRHTEGTLIAAMESIDREIEDPRLKKVMQNKEKAGIGTEATRGATIEGLFKRLYFEKKGKFIIPTERAEKLIALMEQAVPHMTDPVLTALWEDQLSRVENGTLPLATFEAQLATWLHGQIDRIRKVAVSSPHLAPLPAVQQVPAAPAKTRPGVTGTNKKTST